ncbi:MAG: c-type cytochrome biogenesis protein CcmI [Methylophaga sp.]|nr:c-type cytochrome biogenesis protein CcmI [Methylophaga sp.]
MTLFIMIVVIMSLFAIAIIAVPFWKTSTTVTTNNINIELFKTNEARLNQQYQAGGLNEEDYKQALTELQLALLDDANGSARSVNTNKTDTGLIIVSMMFVLIMSPLLYFSLGNQQWAEIDSAAQQHKSFPMLVERLALKLEQQPDDIEGWALLSRSYINFKQYDKAANAYAHLHQLVGDEPTLLVEYADVLVMVGMPDALALAEMLLDKALEQTPNNRNGLWVMGNVKFKQYDYEQSLEYLTKAQQQFIAENEPHSELIKQIVRVKNKLE